MFNARKVQFGHLWSIWDTISETVHAISIFLRTPYTKSYILFAPNNFQIVTGATCRAGNAHDLQNTWFHSLWGVHDFTHSLYIHYILLNLSVLGLCLRINYWFVYLKLSNSFITNLFYFIKGFTECRFTKSFSVNRYSDLFTVFTRTTHTCDSFRAMYNYLVLHPIYQILH